MARRLALLSLVSALAIAGGFTSAPAHAGLLPILQPVLQPLVGGACGTTTAAFYPVDGDRSAYYFAPNGGFESGSTGWTLAGGAKVVAGNESYYLHATTDRYSLYMPSGSRATSPSACFGTLNPGARFMARSLSGSGSIHVRLMTRSLLGVLSVLDGGNVPVGSKWGAVDKVGTLWSQLAVLAGTKSVQIELTANGDVQVDDLYIDPFWQDC